MSGDRPEPPSSAPDSNEAGFRSRRDEALRSFSAAHPADPNLLRPRLKMVATSGDLTPAGASYTPPTPAPLPERGAGFFLFLSVIGAAVALVFLVLLIAKI